MKLHPTQERLKELFEYNLETGYFVRKVKSSNRVKVGDIVGCKRIDGYIKIQVDKVLFQAHRLAWIYVHGEIPEGLFIDHINGVKNDNRICNLRLATKKQNCQNQRNPSSNNTSGFLGVTFHKHLNKFMAQISVDGKVKHLGYFTSPELAHQAYLEAKRRLHEFGTI